MDKRYQVFISSTYADLQEERQEIMQALLELDCIPSGMELFPAADEHQWSLIKRVIDDCDYYILVMGGRYGSVGADGISYTEMEYRYALETGKPIIAFLHKAPETIAVGKSESSEEGKKKLLAFRELASKKLCRFWTSPAELGSQVSRSLVQLIKTSPAIGWVRADRVPDESAAIQMVHLHQKIEQLEAELVAARATTSHDTSDLAQGDDQFTLHFTARARDHWGNDTGEAEIAVGLSWNQIFGAIAPGLIDEANERVVHMALSRLAHAEAETSLRDLFGKAETIRKSEVKVEDFETVIVQLRALKLIDRSAKPRSVKDTGTYWTLTAAGDAAMTKFRAIPRPLA